MSDEENSEGVEGSPSAPAAEGGEPEPPPPAKTEDGNKSKRKARRKSVWVLVPVEWDEVAVNEADGTVRAVRQPTRYSITECPGGEGQKKAILRVLAQHQIDPTNYEGVLMFRADPIPFEIGQQMIIRI